MSEETGARGTFIIRILNTQHETWQGTLTWTEEKRVESFRSALELVNLIDSAMGCGEKTPPPDPS